MRTPWWSWLLCRSLMSRVGRGTRWGFIEERFRTSYEAWIERVLTGLGGGERDACVDLLDELPLTLAGRLHETAFRALVEERVWPQREANLLSLSKTDEEVER